MWLPPSPLHIWESRACGLIYVAWILWLVVLSWVVPCRRHPHLLHPRQLSRHTSCVLHYFYCYSLASWCYDYSMFSLPPFQPLCGDILTSSPWLLHPELKGSSCFSYWLRMPLGYHRRLTDYTFSFIVSRAPTIARTPPTVTRASSLMTATF